MVEDSFKEHKLMILGDLKRQNDSLIKLQDIVSVLAIEIGQLKIAEKIRASMYGGIGGIIAAVIMTVLLEKIIK